MNEVQHPGFDKSEKYETFTTTNGLKEAAENRVTENGRFKITSFEKMRIEDIMFGAEWMAEQRNVDSMNEALRIEYEKGKADALKDMPRWRKIGQGNNYSSEAEFCINGRYLEMNDTLNCLYEIALKDLEKLPKEDEE